MTKKIFLFNGPPSSGKDTAAEAMASLFDEGTLVKFAEPLKDGAKALFGLDDEEFKVLDTDPVKSEPNEVFFGRSCRDIQILLSEEFLKRVYDKRIFGQILTSKIVRDSSTLYFVSDSGFQEEAEVLIDHFGADNVRLIRIHRTGKSFEGDSRSYIDLLHRGVMTFDVENPEGQIDEFLSRVESIVKQFI